MEVLTQKTARRSTRLRVRIPLTMTSLDRRHAFVAECVALIVSAQGAGVQASSPLPIKTPVILSGLPGGVSASAHVASCLPLGNDGKNFLIGVSLYNPGNIWGLADAPEDWNCASAAGASAAVGGTPEPQTANSTKPARNKKEAWPYNLFSGNRESHPGRK